MPLSAVSYYFGRKPFPLKQKHPLNYTIKIFCFSPDGTKRLFFGSGKQKEPLHSPLSPVIILQFFCILSRKTPNYHENSEQFPCLYHIPRFSTAFSGKLICLSAKTANILLLFTFPLYTITETPDFCVKVYFCLIVRFFPQSPSYQRHQKTQK